MALLKKGCSFLSKASPIDPGPSRRAQRASLFSSVLLFSICCLQTMANQPLPFSSFQFPCPHIYSLALCFPTLEIAQVVEGWDIKKHCLLRSNCNHFWNGHSWVCVTLVTWLTVCAMLPFPIQSWKSTLSGRKENCFNGNSIKQNARNWTYYLSGLDWIARREVFSLWPLTVESSFWSFETVIWERPKVSGELIWGFLKEKSFRSQMARVSFSPVGFLSPGKWVGKRYGSWFGHVENSSSSFVLKYKLRLNLTVDLNELILVLQGFIIWRARGQLLNWILKVWHSFQSSVMNNFLGGWRQVKLPADYLIWSFPGATCDKIVLKRIFIGLCKNIFCVKVRTGNRMV